MIDVWDSIGRTLMALAIVLLLMGAVAWVARRVLAQRMAVPEAAPLIQIVANSYLAPRKSIALVAIAGEYFVVGLTADSLVPLGRLEDQEAIATLLSTAGSSNLPSSVSPHSMLQADWWQDVAKTFWQGKKGGPDA
ncbi:MAG: flagellar biosynthetic protein FliO [Nitrospira sp.]